jgi:hypothetical protein
LSSYLLSKNTKIKIYRPVILHVVLYGCEIWFVTLREECRLRKSENRVLRRIFGPNRDEIIGWRKMHSEELHKLYSLPNIRAVSLRRMGWAGHVAYMGAKKSAYRVLVGNPEGRR